MFKFGSPGYAYLLLLIPFVAMFLVLVFRRGSRKLEQFAGPDLLEKLTRTVSPGRKRLKALLLVVALALMILAIMRPQYGSRVETVKREGQDVLVALDVSLSMLAEDIRPNRMERAKRAVSLLIDRLQGDRIGLIAFAGEAFVQCPLTLDYGAARLFLSAMDTDLIPTPGTALADAIQKALDAFVGSSNKSKILIVITDGEDHDGRVEELAEKAAEDGVTIYTIGIGTGQGVPIPVYDTAGTRQGFKRDQSGEVVLTRLDETMLREIAVKTGGNYLRASDQGTELDRIYDELAAMEKQEFAARQVTVFDEKFQIPLLLGMALLMAELLLGDRRRVHREWEGRF